MGKFCKRHLKHRDTENTEENQPNISSKGLAPKGEKYLSQLKAVNPCSALGFTPCPPCLCVEKLLSRKYMPQPVESQHKTLKILAIYCRNVND
jgi:hypothetical protein